MANYNPHRPAVLGNEWVPIKSEPYELDTDVERGYSFLLDTSATVVSGAVYMHDIPDNVSFRRTTISVYEADTEHLTGPLQRVVIPPSSGIAIATGAIKSLGYQPSNATGAQVLTEPNDRSYIFAQGEYDIHIWFDVSSFTTQLTGKRIHAVNVLYVMAGDQPLGVEEDGTILSTVLLIVQTFPFPARTLLSHNITPSAQVLTSAKIETVSLGNTYTLGGASGNDFAIGAAPFRLANLQGFQHTVAPRINLRFRSLVDPTMADNAPNNTFSYAALEVLYSDENRLLFGSSGTFDTSGSSNNNYTPKVEEPAPIMLRQPNGSLGKTLSPGRYTVTVCEAGLNPNDMLGDRYTINAVRQLYELPSVEGVEVDLPTRVGQLPKRRKSNVIPQVTLHTASSIVTGVHSYGDQVVAPVYDGGTPIQGVLQQAPSSSTSYPQIRFYARRWGDTDIPLTVYATSDPSVTVSITPEDFDALPEIVDGWREVTLRFDSPASVDNSGGQIEFAFSADGLDVGSRWEILVAKAFGAQLGVYATANATYGGTVAHLELDSNPDNRADATLILSQDSLAPTGVAVSLESLAVTGIGEECSTSPNCVPTSVSYNKITWTQPPDTNVYEDFEDAAFSITIVSGGDEAWFRTQTAAHSGSWSYRSGSISNSQTSQFTVTVPPGAETISFWYKTSTERDFDVLTVFRVGETGTLLNASGVRDWQRFEFNVAGATGVTFRYSKDSSDSAGSDVVWVDDIYFDLGYSLELRRSDDVDSNWQTIMRTNDMTVTSFNDYEARVGVTSYYALRTVNALNFAGPWSTTASGVLTAPGVGGVGDGNSVLIFTSNEKQDGSAVLAYVMSWDTTVSEDFTFSEARDVQLQKMYQRNYVTAFHPLERGGEQFSRNIIVQNAAVSTGRMRDGFRSLRDLAWDSLSYVCVRNELGDRWLANVQVPSGKILRNRRLYVAQLNIVEVTDTPSEVDPSA